MTRATESNQDQTSPDTTGIDRATENAPRISKAKVMRIPSDIEKNVYDVVDFMTVHGARITRYRLGSDSQWLKMSQAWYREAEEELTEIEFSNGITWRLNMCHTQPAVEPESNG